MLKGREPRFLVELSTRVTFTTKMDPDTIMGAKLSGIVAMPFPLPNKKWRYVFLDQVTQVIEL